jgi:hypothetical protein
VLFKPFRVDQLLDTIEKMLSRRQVPLAGTPAGPDSR